MNGLYHGGIKGLRIGDELIPAPPHVEDGCPICVARSEGRVYTVGEYREYLQQFGEQSAPVLKMLDGEPDFIPIDPPSVREAVYLTSDIAYARWYAARSKGDLYRVEPIGATTESTEDPFPTWTAPKARIVEVVERGVRLVRSERRSLFREWGKADKRLARKGPRS